MSGEDPFKPCCCSGQCGRVHAAGQCPRDASASAYGSRRKIGDSFVAMCRSCAELVDIRAAELPGLRDGVSSIKDDKDQTFMF